mmetsp:Transcript_28194/g.56912  ORF Transcript_28194/g.56912 Transcript_28194/m.56912 type:complete len:228 (+) Transcript_28194:490-1173(+)
MENFKACSMRDGQTSGGFRSPALNTASLSQAAHSTKDRQRSRSLAGCALFRPTAHPKAKVLEWHTRSQPQSSGLDETRTTSRFRGWVSARRASTFACHPRRHHRSSCSSSSSSSPAAAHGLTSRASPNRSWSSKAAVRATDRAGGASLQTRTCNRRIQCTPQPCRTRRPSRQGSLSPDKASFPSPSTPSRRPLPTSRPPRRLTSHPRTRSPPTSPTRSFPPRARRSE